jgi:type I restriction enzyme, S subunit
MPAVDAQSGTIANPERRPFMSVRKGYTAFRDGDVIFAKITPCMENGKAAIARNLINGQGFGSTEFHVLRASKSVIPEYLFYYVRQESFRRVAEAEMTGSVGQKRVPSDFLKDADIPLPPLAEQKLIVAKIEELLPKVNAVRERLNRVKEIMKRFRQSVLSAAFRGALTRDFREGKKSTKSASSAKLPSAWKITDLEKIITDGAKNGLYKPQSFYGSGIPIVRIDNFYEGEIAPWSDLKRLELTEEELSSFGLKEKDILINRVNSMPFLGKSGIVRRLKADSVFESNMMRIRVAEETIDPEFLIRYLNSPFGLAELRKNAKHAVNQSSINQHDVKSVRVILPPKPEQKRIVHLIDSLFKLADMIEKRFGAELSRTEKMTQSILAKAFRGELVPTDTDLKR